MCLGEECQVVGASGSRQYFRTTVVGRSAGSFIRTTEEITVIFCSFHPDPWALAPIVNYDVLHRMSLLAMALDLHELDITDIEFIASFEAMEHAHEFILLVLRQ